MTPGEPASPGTAPPGAKPSGGRAFGFPRAQRLKRRRLIRPLFARDGEGTGRVAAGVVQLRYRVVPREATGTTAPLQVGFAPGRRATSVLRNRIRRLMREAWRLHQHALAARFAAGSSALTVFAVFRGRDDQAEAVARDLPEALRRLGARLDAPPLPPTP